MGIRKKIFVGFIIIGFILFLSGTISILQLFGMEKSISGMLSDNVKSIDISKYMMDEVEAQSWHILDIIANDKIGESARIDTKDHDFEILFTKAHDNITAEGEKEVLDSLKASFLVYTQTVKSIDSMFVLSKVSHDRPALFLELYRPAYLQFNAAIRKLRAINQNALSENSIKLENNFYRMIMPPIIAIAAGLLLIILFNYFISLYFVNPVLRISKGLGLFINNKISYNVTVDTSDEINELNEQIKVLIAQLKKKELQDKVTSKFKL